MSREGLSSSVGYRILAMPPSQANFHLQPPTLLRVDTKFNDQRPVSHGGCCWIVHSVPTTADSARSRKMPNCQMPSSVVQTLDYAPPREKY